jgi:hypothetical protein
MNYLLPKDYIEIIYTTIENELSPDLIRDLFFNQWERNKKDNPNFLDELAKQILFIGKEQDGILKSKFKALNIQKEHSVKLIEGYKLLIDKVENVEESTEQSTEENTENEEFIINKKIKWNGGPSDFGFLINQLIKQGWIDKPYKSNKDNAKFFINLFDIETINGKTTIGTLAKELSENSYSLSLENEKMFKIPHIDKMRKLRENDEKVKEIK